METSSITASTSTTTSSASNAASALSGDDFFQLLIAQLINQDPLEPTSNQDLLNQISSIREIELSTSLSQSLESLTEQQRFASAGSLIGHRINGTDTDGNEADGVVVAVRFNQSGKALLELESGSRIPLDEIDSVLAGTSPSEGLTGRFVTGVDTSDPENPSVVEGVVTGVTTDSDGRLILELDTGETLAVADVIDARAAEDDDTSVDLLGLVSELL